MITRGKAGPAWVQVPSAKTPLESLPLGALVQVPVKGEFHSLFGEHLVFRVADIRHPGYPADSVTLITDNAIFAMCYDAAEPENPNVYRAYDGNNRYIHSNIAQWLNSDAPPGQWFEPTHPYDAPPTQENVYQNINASDHLPGFLHIWREEFASKLLLTNLTVRQSKTDGDSIDSLEAKVFLPASTELGLSKEGSVEEGPKFPLFDVQSRVCSYTPEALANCTLAEDQPAKWWLRTPSYNTANAVRYVDSSGLRLSTMANFSNLGVRPVCNLPASALVSPPNQQGIHTLLP